MCKVETLLIKSNYKNVSNAVVDNKLCDYIHNLSFRNLSNEYIALNRPRSSEGVGVVPHSTLLYSTRAKHPSHHHELIKQSSYAVPMHSINYQEEIKKDPAMVRILKKQDYEWGWHLLKKRLGLRRKLGNQPEQLISGDMIKYIETGEQDPTPNVSSEFDSIFCGGNLEVVDIEGKIFLAQPSMCDEYAIRLVKPSSELQHIKLKTDSKWLLENYTYEIMSTEYFIGLRRKKSFDFMVRDDIHSDQFELKTTISYPWFKEIVASTFQHDTLTFIDVDYNLVRNDIDSPYTDSPIDLPIKTPKDRFPISINSFSYNNNIITYTDLKSLNIVDFRDGKVNKIFGEENYFLKCEELSYHKNSLHDADLIYIASSHLLYLIDLRKTKDFVMHWNHQLIQQPTMLKQVKYEGAEVICLSSNMQGDLKMFNCSTNKEENSWEINWFPFKPHNASQSYSKVREKGLLLISDPIKTRVAMSTTGISMIAEEKKSRIKLFTQNYVGDIFKSFLSCKNDSVDNEKKLIRNFQLWNKTLKVEHDPFKFVPLKERIEKDELEFDYIMNLKGLTKVMRCKKLQVQEEDIEEINTEINPRWRFNFEEAKEFQDLLSQHILAEWDLKIEETHPKLYADALKEESQKKVNSADKVLQWLDNLIPFDADETVDESICDVSMKDENKEIMLEGDVIDPDLTFTQSQTQQTDTSKKPKKFSQRRKGF